MRLGAALAELVVLSGCGERAPAVPGRPSALPGAAAGQRNHFAPEAAVSDRGRSLIATARGRRIAVRVAGRRRTLSARRFNGHRLPLVVLVKRRRGGWLQVYLPTRPNLSTGWLRTRDVRLTQTTYRLQIRLRSHRVILWHGRRAVLRAPIGTGRAVSPTPTGRYYVTDLIARRTNTGSSARTRSACPRTHASTRASRAAAARSACAAPTTPPGWATTSATAASAWATR